MSAERSSARSSTMTRRSGCPPCQMANRTEEVDGWLRREPTVTEAAS
jgi:hypothetical protein